MATFRVDGLDETIRKLEKAGRFGEIAPKAVDAAAPIVEGAVRSAVSAAASKGYATGNLAGSIKKTKTKMNQRGAFSVVKPNGRDEKGASNTDKLLSLEYGNSHQAPHPCLAAAVNGVEAACIEAMEQTIQKEMELE
ncbi:MAG: hypothetical protein Q4E91_06120 [Lachnospiraceae bacterium]|nr:hypothetical protein [Lachnospiraceae bacterium]